MDSIQALVVHSLRRNDIDSADVWTRRHTALWADVYAALEGYASFCEGWPAEWGSIPRDPADLDLRAFIQGPAAEPVSLSHS